MALSKCISILLQLFLASLFCDLSYFFLNGDSNIGSVSPSCLLFHFIWVHVSVILSVYLSLSDLSPPPPSLLSPPFPPFGDPYQLLYLLPQQPPATPALTHRLVSIEPLNWLLAAAPRQPSRKGFAHYRSPLMSYY